MGMSLWKVSQIAKENFELGAASRDAEIESLRQQLASRDAEVAVLREQVTLLRDALWRIAYPIDAIQARLLEGEKLNGAMAVMIASDPSYLKGIAQEALAATDDLDGLILCHAEPIGWRLENDGVEYGITSYNREQADEYVAAGWNLKETIYRAWEPK